MLEAKCKPRFYKTSHQVGTQSCLYLFHMGDSKRCYFLFSPPRNAHHKRPQVLIKWNIYTLRMFNFPLSQHAGK